MKNEFTSIIEHDGDGYIGYCAEIPGANGQGETIEECLQNLAEAAGLYHSFGSVTGFPVFLASRANW